MFNKTSVQDKMSNKVSVSDKTFDNIKVSDEMSDIDLSRQARFQLEFF